MMADRDTPSVEKTRKLKVEEEHVASFFRVWIGEILFLLTLPLRFMEITRLFMLINITYLKLILRFLEFVAKNASNIVQELLNHLKPLRAVFVGFVNGMKEIKESREYPTVRHNNSPNKSVPTYFSYTDE